MTKITPEGEAGQPDHKLTGRQVERIALPDLEVSVLRAGLQLATPNIDAGIVAIVLSTEPGIRARPLQVKSCAVADGSRIESAPSSISF